MQGKYFTSCCVNYQDKLKVSTPSRRNTMQNVYFLHSYIYSSNVPKSFGGVCCQSHPMCVSVCICLDFCSNLTYTSIALDFKTQPRNLMLLMQSASPVTIFYNNKGSKFYYNYSYCVGPSVM